MSIDWHCRRVLITGGTGFIGSILAEEFLARGAKVRVPVRARNYRALSQLRAQIEWCDGDLRDPVYCSSIVDGVDHVLHLASFRRNSEFHRKNASDVLVGNLEMSLALIQALRKSPNTHVTFFSTANVPPSIDVIALAQREYVDGYILGKAMSEAAWLTASRQAAFPLLILRPVGVYGERDTFTRDGNVIPALMVKARDDKEISVWGSGQQQLAFLYVRDLIACLFALLEVDARGVQYVVPPELVTVKSLATAIRDIVAPGKLLQFDPSRPEGARSLAVLPQHPCLSSYSWTSLVDGLRRTYDGWQHMNISGEQRS